MDVDSQILNANSQTARPSKWRRAAVATSVVLALSMTAMSLIPTGLALSGYPLKRLNAALENYGLTAEASTFVGGVLHPIEFHRVTIQDEAGHVVCTAAVLQTDTSLLSEITAGSASRGLVLVDPVLELSLDDSNELPFSSSSESDSSSEEDLEFEIRNGSLTVRVAWRELPIVDLHGLDIRGRIQQEDDGRWLTVDPVTLFDREPLSEDHTEQNLALIAPVLSQSTRLEGTVSAQLDPVRVRLDTADSSIPVLGGSAEIHSLQAELKPAWSRALVGLIPGHQETASTDCLRLTSETTITFGLTENGIQHRGCTLLLPDVGSGWHVVTSGVVGMDAQLDLSLDVQVPSLANSGSPFLRAMSQLVAAPFQLRIVGTVSDPVLMTKSRRPLLDELTARADPEGFTELPPAVADSVGRLIQASQSDRSEDIRQQLPGRVFGLIRSIKAAKEDRQP